MAEFLGYDAERDAERFAAWSAFMLKIRRYLQKP
jgi:hypothetical protein